MNIARTRESLAQYDITEHERKVVERRLDRLWERIESEPKSRAWRLRDRIGDRKKWYDEPEEVGDSTHRAPLDTIPLGPTSPDSRRFTSQWFGRCHARSAASARSGCKAPSDTPKDQRLVATYQLVITANLKGRRKMPSKTQLTAVTYPISVVTLRTEHLTAVLTDMGARLLELHAPDRRGHQADVVLGRSNMDETLADRNYLGSTAGRYAGRISWRPVQPGRAELYASDE